MSSEPARSTGPDTFVAVAPFWYATNLGGLVMNGVVAVATKSASARPVVSLANAGTNAPTSTHSAANASPASSRRRSRAGPG